MSYYDPGNGKALLLESTIVVALSSPLKVLAYHVKQMMLESQAQIASCDYPLSKTQLLPVRRMAEFEKETKARQDAPQKDYVLERVAKYYKLHRLLLAGLSECYETLYNYCADLRNQAQAAEEVAEQYKVQRARVSVAEEIIFDYGFKQVERVALGGITGEFPHPKVDAFLNQCRNLLALQRPGLVFVGNKLLGETLAQKLWAGGMRAEKLMGAKAQNQTQHLRAIQRFLSGEAQFLIATSVAEAEHAYQNLEAGGIICYTPPHTSQSMRARESQASGDELTFINTLVAAQSPDSTFWLLKATMQKEAAKQDRKDQPPVQLVLQPAD